MKTAQPRAHQLILLAVCERLPRMRRAPGSGWGSSAADGSDRVQNLCPHAVTASLAVCPFKRRRYLRHFSADRDLISATFRYRTASASNRAMAASACRILFASLMFPLHFVAQWQLPDRRQQSRRRAIPIENFAQVLIRDAQQWSRRPIRPAEFFKLPLGMFSCEHERCI